MTANWSRSGCDWKSVFPEQRNKGIGVWSGQFTDLRMPKMFNLRADPFERGDDIILEHLVDGSPRHSSRCTE